MGICFNCGGFFTFNPERVPSIRVRRDGSGNLVRDLKATKEPICRSCVERANPIRIARGLQPIEILDGAYDPEPDSDFDLEGDE